MKEYKVTVTTMAAVGINEKYFYLFFGKNEEVTDAMIYKNIETKLDPKIKILYYSWEEKKS